MKDSRRRGTLVVALTIALLVVPVVALALVVPSFDDVPESHTHFDGIEWMKTAGVTLGCDADSYCPDDAVTRAQMGTFMYRFAQYLGAVDGTVNAADSAAAVTGDIVLSQDGSAWQDWGTGGPSYIENWVTYTRFGGDGDVNIGLTGPATIGGQAYGLSTVEFCLNVKSGAVVDQIWVYQHDGASATDWSTTLSDPTDRSTNECLELTVNSQGTTFGIGVRAKSGGEVELSGVTSTWTTAAAVTSSGLAESDGNNG